MSDFPDHPVPQAWSDTAWIDRQTYQSMYRQSIDNPEQFWADQATQFLTWNSPWDTVCESDISQGAASWFSGGKLNVAVNCIDRHLSKRAQQTAIIWEGDDPADDVRITYAELHDQVSRLGNVLRERGVKKGDRVCIYMPMIPQAAYAMLACARIGAVHSVVFGGFSPDALKDRILDSDCQVVITADEGLRAGKPVPLKANTDQALSKCPNVHTCIVVKRTGNAINWSEGRDHWYHDVTAAAAEECVPEIMDAEDPLFILYTSGSTGKPKGVLHTTGGYLLMAAMTHKYTFDYKEGDIFWCTADVGWVTGHSYSVYGPLCNGGITLMFEGVPTYPDASRFWQVVDKHQVTQFYTAPTAIRSLMGAGDQWVVGTSRQSLKLLGTVGEPINPEAWEWYFRVVGDSRCPIVDTWWQTETGGIMISPLAGITPNKPAHASLPLPGIQPIIVDAEGNELKGNNVEGNLCIKFPWPSMIRTTYGDHQRCKDTYFSTYPGMYFTGDGAKRDHDGYIRILGRVDDVINVSGHRIGTAEVEDAINQHPKVVESAVVGFPHDIKGQGIYAYVICSDAATKDDTMRKEMEAIISDVIGRIAKPDKIQFVTGLPKTRSGKIMRRILRKVAEGELNSLGDTSTLLDPDIVDYIKAGAK